MSPYLAVDFGGTHIRVAYFLTGEPPPESQSKTATLASEGPEAVINRLFQSIEAQLPEQRDTLRIGVGAPGPMDPHRGVILRAVNLPGWENIPLKDDLEKRFGCPVFVGNDANIAALGEWRFGAGKGTSNLIYLTISTGIGGGVIIENRLLIGTKGLAAELGHMTIKPDGPKCSCGQHGHIEALASGPSLARRATTLIESGRTSSLSEIIDQRQEISGKDVGEAAQAGDPLASEIIEQAGEHIGHHLANLAHAFDPQIFVLGGGVTQLGEQLFEPIRRSLKAHVMDPYYLQNLQVLPAALGDDAGLIGAMVLASIE
jgi:glucokinase